MAGIKQISVFLSNKSGRIAKVLDVLAKNGIDITALSIADGMDRGTLRMITDDQDKALKVLKEAEFIAKVTEVLAVEIPNTPGALSKVLNEFDSKAIEVEYIYAFVGKHGNKARVIIRVNDNDAAAQALEGTGARVLGEDDLD